MYYRSVLLVVSHLACDNFPGFLRARFGKHFSILKAFQIPQRYFWSELRSVEFTIGIFWVSTASNLTIGRFSHDAKDLPIGSVVLPSSFSNKCLNGSSFPWSWQITHCNGRSSSFSILLIMLMYVVVVRVGDWEVVVQEFLLTVRILPEKLSERLALGGFTRRRSPWWRSGFYRGTAYRNVQEVLIGGWRLGVLKVHLLTRGWRKTVQRRSDDLHELVSLRWEL